MSGDSAAIRSAIAGCIRSTSDGVQIEAIARLGETELVEEDLGHDVVPVLPRVQHDLVDARVAQSGRERRGLDELRAVPDDGEDLHATKPTNARRLRLTGLHTDPSTLGLP